MPPQAARPRLRSPTVPSQGTQYNITYIHPQPPTRLPSTISRPVLAWPGKQANYLKYFPALHYFSLPTSFGLPRYLACLCALPTLNRTQFLTQNQKRRKQSIDGNAIVAANANANCRVAGTSACKGKGSGEGRLPPSSLPDDGCA